MTALNVVDFYQKLSGGFIDKPNERQFNGFCFIIEEFTQRGLTDLRWLAYILATAFHETAHTMQPVEEIGKGRGRKYGQPDPETGKTYYGRGYCQLTYKANYAKATKLYGVDFVNNPELALSPPHAAAILFDGMIDGWYTGVGLAKFFNEENCDWINARRIVNGMDRANDIAALAQGFFTALSESIQQESTVATNQMEVEMAQATQNTQSQPQQAANGFLDGKKTHIGMVITGGIGLASMFGIIPGIDPAQGAEMLQTAFGVSGFRAAIPGLIKMAIDYKKASA